MADLLHAGPRDLVGDSLPPGVDKLLRERQLIAGPDTTGLLNWTTARTGRIIATASYVADLTAGDRGWMRITSSPLTSKRPRK